MNVSNPKPDPKPNTTRTSRGLWVALVVTLGATLWLTSQDEGDDLLASPAAGAARPGSNFSSQVSRPSADPSTRLNTTAQAQARTVPDASQAPASVHPEPATWWAERLQPWRERQQGTEMPGAPDARPDSLAWQAAVPPPPAAPVSAQPAPEGPPAFPYPWVGQVVDGQPRAVIAGPQRTWLLAVGDTLDGQWRLQSLSDRQLTFLYLPLQQPLVVSARSSSTP